MSRRLRVAFVLGPIALGLGACSGPETRSSPAENGGARSSAAAVSSGTAPVASPSGTARPGAPRASWGEEREATPLAGGGGARGAQAPAGQETTGTARGRRERLVEEAASEDRPAGRSEAHFEADGVTVKSGVVMPHYTIRSIDSKEGPRPDPAIEKALPGSKLDLPPPEPVKKPEIQKAGEQPVEAPGPVVPKPVD